MLLLGKSKAINRAKVKSLSCPVISWLDFTPPREP